MLVSPACTLSTIRSASCRILVALSCSSCFSLRAFFAFAWFLSEWTNKSMSSAIMCLQRTSLLFQLECGFLRIWNKSISNKKSQSRLSLSLRRSNQRRSNQTKDQTEKQHLLLLSSCQKVNLCPQAEVKHYAKQPPVHPQVFLLLSVSEWHLPPPPAPSILLALLPIYAERLAMERRWNLSHELGTPHCIRTEMPPCKAGMWSELKSPPKRFWLLVEWRVSSCRCKVPPCHSQVSLLLFAFFLHLTARPEAFKNWVIFCNQF